MSNAPLCSFRAGRSNRVEGSNRVEADPERGLLYVFEEDGLMHFCWTNHQTANPVQDLILFPGDASFQAVPHAARTFVLKFASSSARHFFWCQDPDGSQDSSNAARINELIQAQEEEDVEMDESPSAAAAPAVQASNTETQQQQIANILASFGQSAAASASTSQFAAYALPDLISPISSTLPLAKDPAAQSALYQYFPSGLDQTPENLQRILSSVELKKSLGSLDSALRTGALAPLVTALGLEESAALGLDEFLQAIQAKADKEKNAAMQTD